MLSVLLVGVILGLVLWAVMKYVPMQPPFPTVIVIVVAVLYVIWALNTIGVGLPKGL